MVVHVQFNKKSKKVKRYLIKTKFSHFTNKQT